MWQWLEKSCCGRVLCEWWCSLACGLSGCVLSSSTWTESGLGGVSHWGCSVISPAELCVWGWGRVRAHDSLCRYDDTMKRFPLGLGGVSKPHSDTAGEKALCLSLLCIYVCVLCCYCIINFISYYTIILLENHLIQINKSWILSYFIIVFVCVGVYLYPFTHI